MIKAVGYYRKVEITRQNSKINLHERAKKYYINHFALVNTGVSMCFTLVEEFINREVKVFEELKELNYIDYAFIDKNIIKVITLFRPERILNRGLEIRDKKRKKQAKKRYTIKENQNDLVRIVKVKYPIFKRVKGKYKLDKMNIRKGVQVENKVYFLDGYIFVNKSGVKVKPLDSLSNVSNEIFKMYEEKRLKYSKN